MFSNVFQKQCVFFLKNRDNLVLSKEAQFLIKLFLSYSLSTKKEDSVVLSEEALFRIKLFLAHSFL